MRLKRLVPFLLLALIGGCEDLGPSGPSGPGTLRIDLVSPNGAEGSAVFEVRGATGIGSVSASNALVFYHHGAEATRVVVVNDEPGEIGFRLQVEEVRDVPSVTLTQVADALDRLRSSLAGYEVEVFSPETGGVR